MIRQRITIILSALLVAAILAPVQAQASVPRKPDDGRRQYWRSGFILTAAPTYTSMIGKGSSFAARMLSNTNTDMYFAFPAVSGKPYIRKASYNLLSRSGTYAGTARLTLDVYNFEGVFQRSLSSEIVDLQTTTVQSWTNLTLDSDVEDCQLQQDEFLAFHLALDGSPGGNLDIRPIFEIATEPILSKFHKYFFPLALNSSR